MPSAAETKKINDELHKLGFGNLKDPGLVPAIAYYIKSHEQFRSQLFSVMPDKRKIAYDALRPHLRFEAKPLDVYEAEIKLEAEKQQWGRYNQDTHMVDPFKVGEVWTCSCLCGSREGLSSGDSYIRTDITCPCCDYQRCDAHFTKSELEKVAGDRPEPACMCVGGTVPGRCPQYTGCEYCWPDKPRLEKVAEKAIEAAEEEQRWLHLICVKCTAMDSYGATTRNDADLMATEKGWRQSDGKSYCKKCAKKFLIH